MLAGAGTGKTAALTARLAHLIATRKAWPSQILAVTFTNKAAREMKERVGRLSGGAIEGMPWLGTFHSVGAQMLRRHAELVGLQSNFTILDTDDQLRLLKQLISAANLDEKRWPARQLAGLIDRWKNRGWTPTRSTPARPRPSPTAAAPSSTPPTRSGCAPQRLRLRRPAAAHADHLPHPRDVLEHYRERFRYILVDEYQDTNQSQYDWLKLLAEPRRNLCCVGDDDQSIYSWRGAEVANILRFEKDFPGAKIIRLEQNYRSTPHILAAASGLIANNAGRLGKTLWTERDEGDKVRVIGVWDGPEEARRVGEEIETHPAPRRLARRLRDPRPRPVPDPRVRGALHRHRPALPDRRRLPLLRARRDPRRPRLSRLIAQPADDLAFERIVNSPSAASATRRSRIHAHARAPSQPLLLAAAPMLDTDELTRARRSLGRFVADIARWRQMAGRAAPSRARPHHARRERLHRHAPGRAQRRGRRPAREPRRADPRDGGI